MKVAGIVDLGTDLHNPEFAKIAEGEGLLGLTRKQPTTYPDARAGTQL
jgi:pyruvate dehydrogenase (quinone)